MSCIGQAQQQVSEKLIKTDGDDSDTPVPESDKDDLGQILNTEESKGKPMKTLRFSLQNQVWIFDRASKRHQSYKSPSPLAKQSSPSILKNKIKQKVTKQ
ncbi:unnamed protein product (macronuclear) [Paramecium tetraurelia]|uniref:Uncharacterized protein n=1 Tax=Paramecium tetraurelia TaxID=5888 RepID=A0CEA5_PARTE|nr:uncharacterized protein GSPATT00037558001 [Paramecium tetraurelia]CAK69122.1 unnamed protein product [Paramecium tetraurelia]|eukprot:XP_001436519.1 hypothetical protein (macronuclear) [Paramecium tetraurelia strain d4-2]